MKLPQLMQREPVRMGQALLILVEAVVMVTITFIPHLTSEQSGAIMGLGMAVILVSQIGVAELIRSQVTPIVNLRDKRDHRLAPAEPTMTDAPTPGATPVTPLSS